MVRRAKLSSLLTLVCAWLACALATRAAAQGGPASELPRGISESGLCGLVHGELPLCGTHLLGVSGTAGYGYTEAFGRATGAHHRLAGTLGVGGLPLPWLGLGLRIDGRYDVHPEDAQGADSTAVGDPRLFARAGHRVRDDLTIGGSLALWFPGADAPSFRFEATSLDLKALAVWTPRARAWSLLGNLGFRIDNSANTAPDLARLRRGDRLSLGLSDSHALLLVVGANYRLRTDTELFAETSADILVGKNAPSVGKSPWRASVGGRYFLSDALQFELTLTFALSGRPSQRAAAPLVPVEPRMLSMAGVRWGMVKPKPPAQAPDTQDPLSSDEPAVTGNLIGVLTDDRGAPLPEVVVTLKTGDLSREAITDAKGRYSFLATPVGPAELNAEAAGFAPQSWRVVVVSNMPAQPVRALTPQGDTAGTLRCLTRTFGSEPLRAQISVRDRRGREVAKGTSNEQGLFEIALRPGDYHVIIAAPGYRSHRQNVTVASNGVAILNVDMREK
jgi:hypothetical protein